MPEHKPRLTLLDTTLRDGEQRVGVTLTLTDKLRIAERLDGIGVHYIEAGYPASNQRDRQLFERLAAHPPSSAQVVAFGSTRHKDQPAEADPGLRALADCPAEVVAIVGKASPLHVTAVLEATLDQNLAMVAESVRWLSGQGKRVFFDAEHYFDGYAADAGYALAVLEAAKEAGAEMLVLCDTNGGSLPHEVFETCQATGVLLPGADLGIHCHDDSGVGVANSLMAVLAGCVHVQGTVNGYGERAGNADLLVVLADLQLKMGYDLVGPEQMSRLTETAYFTAEVMNIAPDPHRPYSGTAAFSHKGGLHTAAAARYRPSYEHIDPALVGNFSRIVLGELSGKTALAAKAAELGVALPGPADERSSLLEEIKRREAEGFSYEAAEASLKLYLEDLTGAGMSYFELESFRVITDKHRDGKAVSEATIKLWVGDQRIVQTAEGVGPVNALDAALRQAITGLYPEVAAFELADFKVRVIDESTGTAAVTRVLIDTTDGEQNWGTIGVSENIIEASWDALVDSIAYGLMLAGRRL